MAVVYSVMGDTLPEAAAALRKLCETFGLEPAGPPSEVIGRDKWMGRARLPSTDKTAHD